MEPNDNQTIISINWNAGYRDGKRRVSNFLLGASWSHHPSFPVRKTHIYLGLWTLTVSTPSK